MSYWGDGNTIPNPNTNLWEIIVPVSTKEGHIKTKDPNAVSLEGIFVLPITTVPNIQLSGVRLDIHTGNTSKARITGLQLTIATNTYNITAKYPMNQNAKNVTPYPIEGGPIVAADTAYLRIKLKFESPKGHACRVIGAEIIKN